MSTLVLRTIPPVLPADGLTISEQELRAIHTINAQAQDLMRGTIYLPNRQTMLCSRRHSAFWATELGGEGEATIRPR